ncbi:hypothetical protein Q7P37_010564 [Cladosporium fusiforme]
MSNRRTRAQKLSEDELFQYQPPAIERPSRVAKTAATARLMESSSSPVPGSPRRDSRLDNNKGKRKRDVSDKSGDGYSESSGMGIEGDEETDAQAESGNQASDMDVDEEVKSEDGASGMDIDGQVRESSTGEVGGDFQGAEQETTYPSEAETVILVEKQPKNRKLANTGDTDVQEKAETAKSKATKGKAKLVAEKEEKEVSIKDAGEKMKFGDHPRFYAKIVRRKGKEEEDADGEITGPPKAEEEDICLPSYPPILLPRVDVNILQCDFCVPRFSEFDLVRFAMSARVLPLLRMWAYMWLNPDGQSQEFHKKMLKAFPGNQKPWNSQVELIAGFAAKKKDSNIGSAELLYGAARIAWRLVNSNEAANDDFGFFRKFGEKEKAANEPYKFATRLLLAVWEDVESNPDGFFRILFRDECKLSEGLRPEVRQLYECWYIIDEKAYQKQTITSANPADHHNHNGPKPATVSMSSMESVDQQAHQERRKARANEGKLEEGKIRDGEPSSDWEVIEALKALQPFEHPEVRRFREHKKEREQL